MQGYIKERGAFGWMVALLTLIAVFILWLMGKLETQPACLFAALALSRLL